MSHLLPPPRSSHRSACARNRSRPEPLSRQDAQELIGFINGSDPRYTAEPLTTGHPDFPNRAQCFRREGGGAALSYHSVRGYSAEARSEVDDPVFQAALAQWMAARG